ncbi:MAG: radical SAM protein [Pseudomonadota bacterium]
MRLLLITASSPTIRQIRRQRFLNFQQITMPYLASYVPSHWQVTHVDEEAEKINFESAFDLVGVTFHTPSAKHAYDIAHRFRDKGIPVVMGGPHVTLVPDEAQNHADAIFIGQAEETWPRFLNEFELGKHQKVYVGNEQQFLSNIPMARKDLFHRHDYTGGVLFATRGCPNKCEFCSLTVMYGNGLRCRPISEVALEYASFKGKIIIFWDDNLSADLEYAKELFKAISPYQKWWSSQASVNCGHDDEFLSLAAKSGCKQLFLGLESVSQESLNRSGKKDNRVSEYRSIIQNIHSYGIAVQAGIVFGFDHDTVKVFRDTLDFLEDTGVQNATFNILTPYPGTPLFKRLLTEGRILSYDWDKYNARQDVVFSPRNMSPEELLAGFRMANDRFYSVRSMARRLSRSPVGLFWTLPLNLAYTVSTFR